MDDLFAGYANYASKEAVLGESRTANARLEPDTGGTCVTLTCGISVTWTWTF